VACAKDDHAPGAMVVRFEVEFTTPPQVMPTSALEIPFDEAPLGAVRSSINSFASPIAFCSILPPPTVPITSPPRVDEHFSPRVLRRAADGIDHRDCDEGRSRFGELGEFLDEAVRRRHSWRGQRSGVGGQTPRVCRRHCAIFRVSVFGDDDMAVVGWLGYCCLPVAALALGIDGSAFFRLDRRETTQHFFASGWQAQCLAA